MAEAVETVIMELAGVAIDIGNATAKGAGNDRARLVEEGKFPDVFATAVLVGICGCSESGVTADSADSIPCMFVCDNVLKRPVLLN